MPRYIPQPPIDGIPANPWNPHAWVRGEPDIGEDTWIGAFTHIDGTGGLTIGKGCNISCGVSILTHNTVKRCLTGGMYGQIDYQPTIVEDYVFIGEKATVLMGCHIGHHSIIGAGAVVLENTKIPPYSLVVGNPARIVRSIENEIEQWKQEWTSRSEASLSQSPRP